MLAVQPSFLIGRASLLPARTSVIVAPSCFAPPPLVVGLCAGHPAPLHDEAPLPRYQASGLDQGVSGWAQRVRRLSRRIRPLYAPRSWLRLRQPLLLPRIRFLVVLALRIPDPVRMLCQRAFLPCQRERSGSRRAYFLCRSAHSVRRRARLRALGGCVLDRSKDCGSRFAGWLRPSSQSTAP